MESLSQNHLFSLEKLEYTADQLALLASTFQTKLYHLRTRQVRHAEAALTVNEGLFTPELAKTALLWKKALGSLHVLEKHLESNENQEKKSTERQDKISALRAKLSSWDALSPQEREFFHKISLDIETLFRQGPCDEDFRMIEHHKRFLALQELLPYADNAPYLAETIHHYEQRPQSMVALETLQEQIDQAHYKLQTIQRGLWVAWLLCLLLVTIPICLPIATSLWGFKGRQEKLIHDLENLAEAERKKLELAKEGERIAQEIRHRLGDLSLDVVKNTLAELNGLRQEFTGDIQAPMARLLVFLQTRRPLLIQTFGSMPEAPLEALRWFMDCLKQVTITEQTLASYESEVRDAQAAQARATKGYSKDQLVQSQTALEHIVQNKLPVPFDLETKEVFARICTEMPEFLKRARTALTLSVRYHLLDPTEWRSLRNQAEDLSNTFNLCVADQGILQVQDLRSVS